MAQRALSYPQLAALEQQKQIFDEVIGFSSHPAVLDNGGDPQRASVEMVTGNYFGFFHADPVLGRLITREDDRVEGAHSVCVLSYAAWQSRCGGDLRVIGRAVRLNRYPFEIIGVVGPDFTGAELQSRADVWVPLAMAKPLTTIERRNPTRIWLGALAKLRRGESAAEALARLQAASTGINESLPKNRANADATYDFVDGSKGYDDFRTMLRQPLAILIGAVLIVLLIACANLTNLLLARGNERAAEFSVKLALGISRWRLMRQLLCESLLVTFAGGAAALVAARELVSLLLRIFNAGEPWKALDVAIDGRVLMFTFIVCALLTVMIGIYPAWAASRTELATALKGGAGASERRRVVRRHDRRSGCVCRGAAIWGERVLS